MAEIIPDGQLIPLDLSFVKGRVFVRSLTAEDFRQIEKGFPHYMASAGPTKAGRIQDEYQAAYTDEVVAQAVVDEPGTRLFKDRAAVSSLNIRRYNEVQRKVWAAVNGTEQDAEIESLRGLFALVQDYTGEGKSREATALDFWDAASAYVEEARKNVPRLATARSSPES